MNLLARAKWRPAPRTETPAETAPALPPGESADPRQEDDETLVKRSQQGDSSAFDVLL